MNERREHPLAQENLWRRARLWYHTLRPLAPAQLFWRMRRQMGSAWEGPPRPVAVPAAHRIPLELFACHELTRTDDARWLESLRTGEVSLLGQNVQCMDGRNEWNWQLDRPPVACPSRLWAMRWHAWEFAPAWCRRQHLDALASALASWIAAAQRWTPFARSIIWHPHVISHRLIHWAYADNAMDLGFSAAGRASARQQAGWLASHLEYDVRGNHLLRNCRALLVASYWLNTPEARRWRARVLALLPGLIRRQLLNDGGHYERSPMYHLTVLEDITECIGMLRYHNDAMPLCQEWMDRLCGMRQFAAAMTCGDGKMALLNDSALNYGPGVSEMLLWSGRKLTKWGRVVEDTVPRRHFFPDSGYGIVQDEHWRVIVDGGALGPREQPAHAHCDLGAIVASWNDIRVLEDTGVYEYQRGARRHYCRSTAAHNTVVIDGHEQGEFWGEFRLGRRARPRAMHSEGNRHGQVSYTLPQKFTHTRTVKLQDSSLFVEDTIQGNGHCQLAIHWHLGPGFQAESPHQPGIWVHPQLKLRMELPAGWEFQNTQSPYFPEFGREQWRACLSGSRQVQLPFRMQTKFVARLR